MPFYKDPVTNMEHKFAWYVLLTGFHHSANSEKNANSLATIAFEAIAPQIALIVIDLSSTFEKRVDQFHSVLNVEHFGKIDLFTHVANVPQEFKTEV
jgi:hypothetical protein